MLQKILSFLWSCASYNVERAAVFVADSGNIEFLELIREFFWNKFLKSSW